MTTEDIQERCQVFAKSIGEHCSSVLLIVDIPSEDDRRDGIFFTGSGCQCSRVALAHQYLSWDIAEKTAYILSGEGIEDEP